MGLIVQKYGGTSVADASRVKEVAKRVVSEKQKGNEVIVVVSAPAGMTDSLIKRAAEISKNPNPREMDMILSTGEQLSISLLAMAIYELGEEAVSYTAAQAGIFTDTIHTKAKITNIESEKITKELKSGKIVILPGFQGITEQKEITTLGRGGSDITAVAVGCALNADEIEIYTDVDGIYTADPRIVKDARKIDNISYEEMLEMAGSGSKVLHSRSVELAAKNDAVIHLRSSFDYSTGTFVKKEDNTMENVLIRGVSHSRNEAKITIHGVNNSPEILAEVFEGIAAQNINVDIVVHDLSATKKSNISFIIPRDDYDKAFNISSELGKKLDAEKVTGDKNIAKVSIIGIGIKTNPGVAASVFKTLAEQNINIDMVSCSEIKISCIIDEVHTEEAVKALHNKFCL